MKKIGVGIVGCGDIATQRHIPSWKGNGKVNVVAVADIDENRARSVAKKFNIPKWYKDYKEMLEKEKTIEVISICTPTKFHKEHTVEACKKRKHVVVEKPMASTVYECQEMVETAKKNDVKLTICHTLRYYPAVKQAKEWIDKGDIGEVEMLRIVTPYGELQPWTLAQGGALWEVGIHRIYLTLYLLDNIKKVDVITFNKKDPRQNMELIFYTSRGVGITNFLRTDGEETIVIYGTKGSITFPYLPFNIALKEKLYIQKGWGKRSISKLLTSLILFERVIKRGVEYIFKGVRITPHYIIFDQFLKSINGQENIPVTPKEGERTIELLEEIEAKLVGKA